MPHIPKKQRFRPWTAKKRTARDRSSDDFFYNSRSWRKLSLMCRMQEPFCQVCEVEYSQVTDHVIPISQGGAKRDRRNLMAMCHKCHNKKRGIEAHSFGPAIPTFDTNTGLVPQDRYEILEKLKE